MNRERCRAGVWSLMGQARQHEICAENLALAAQMFTERGDGQAATLAIRTCHLHRIWALQAKAQAQALLMVD